MTAKIIKTSDIVRITNAFAGTSFKNYKELSAKIQESRSMLHAAWIDSLDESGGSDKPGGPSYWVYDHPEYNYEAIHCYEKSKAAVRESIQYFLKNVEGKHTKTLFDGDASKISVLDLYNGNGLTTVQFNLNNINAESFNTCDHQVEYMQAAAQDLLGHKLVNHKELPKKKYDVVATLEVFEHYSEPLKHLEQLISLMKPGGYLIESSGFNGSSENIGHFDSYWLWDWKMSFMKARQLTSKVMNHYFDKVHVGFNCCPRIWRLKETFPAEMTPSMAIGKCWEAHPKHYGFGSSVYALKDGVVYRGDVDEILDSVNDDLIKNGKPSIFENPFMFSCCTGPWDIFEVVK